MFWKWYVEFIAHFIAFYEQRAPAYAVESAEWSIDPQNIATYLQNNCVMVEFMNSRHF